MKIYLRDSRVVFLIPHFHLTIKLPREGDEAKKEGRKEGRKAAFKRPEEARIRKRNEEECVFSYY